MKNFLINTLVVILILLLCFTLVNGRRANSRRKNYNPQKKKTDYSKAVTVGAILPKSYALLRKYTSMAKQLEPFNTNFSRNGNSFLHFEFKMLDSTFKPSDLWEAVCDDGLFKTRFNSLIYVQTAFTSKAEILQPSSEHLMSVAQFYQIPVIVWDSPGIIQTNRERLLIQLTPSIAHQGEAMLSLLRRYGWNRFAIVTGRLSGHDTFVNTIRDLVDNSGEFFDITTTIHLPSMENETVTSQLQKLQAAESRVMLLYSSKEEATQIFKVADRMKLSGKNYVWITTKCAILKSTLGAELDEDRGRFPLGMFALYYSHDYEEQVKVIEKALVIWAQAMTNLRSKAEKKGILLRPSYHCNPQNDSVWKYGSIVYEHLLKVKVKLNSGEETIEFKKDGTLKSVSLKVLNLRPKNDRNDEWATVGEWKSGKEVEMYDITWPGNAPAPPIGRPEKYQVKVVTLKEDPYVIYSDPDPNSGTCPPMAVLCRIAAKNLTTGVANATSDPSLYQCCSGLCIDLLKMLAEKIGFDFELFEVSDKIWGAYNAETKQWNGLIKDILDEKADMVMTSLKITPERSAAIDFSVPFLETGITIIVAVRDGVISPTAFLEPYDYPSWCLILVFSVHASGASIFLFEWLSPSGLDRGQKPLKEHRFSLFRSFWLIWSMLFGAAVSVDNPRGVSSRFLGNIWALFAVVFTASYTANLAAFMITKEDYDRLSGIQDWRLRNPKAHKPAFKFATVPHGSTETNLKNNYPQMYDYMKPFNKSTVEEGVKAVKDGDINAFIYDATVLEYMAGQDDGCKLRTVGTWYAMTGYGIGFPKGSKWKKVIDKYLLQFQHEAREMERLQKFWLSGACSTKKDEGESSMPLGILNFTSAFILLAGGMLLGAVLLILEHIYFKFFRVKLRKWDKCGCCGLVSLSMGKSLTFEQSVKEAINLQRNYKCKNALCETHLWRTKHELDLALLHVDRLEAQLSSMGIEPERVSQLLCNGVEISEEEKRRRRKLRTRSRSLPSSPARGIRDPSAPSRLKSNRACYIHLDDNFLTSIEKETVL